MGQVSDGKTITVRMMKGHATHNLSLSQEIQELKRISETDVISECYVHRFTVVILTIVTNDCSPSDTGSKTLSRKTT